MKDVKLDKLKNYLIRELSGGKKRRFSLLVALIGELQIFFSDEPTTGLDPKNKKGIWGILSHCKENRYMILTKNLMNEAETLCDRIGIILKRKLRCLGLNMENHLNYMLF